MKNLFFACILSSVILILSCHSKHPEAQEKKQRIVLHFELDSAGNILDTEVKKRLAELAASISTHADRVMLYSYTEKMKTSEESLAIATQQAYAAKSWMYQSAQARIYYSVGLDIQGFENPVDKTKPYSKINRRIEIEYL